ncbi:MAG: hypothetical protein KBS65_00170 [Prevotella sp.]|nr:hypothetical protein [Candidatus Equicola stercoris]
MTEHDLQKMVGNKNPFRVPEGYFDDLTQRIVSSAVNAERKEFGKTKFFTLKRIISVAACVLFFVVAISFLYNKMNVGDNMLSAQDMEIERYVGEMNEYAMFDNGDLYACIEDNND